MTEKEPVYQSKTLFSALLAVQKELEGVEKDAQNEYFKSSYSTLAATIDACKSILNKHDIIVVQEPTFEKGQYDDDSMIYILRTRIIYTITGEEIRSDYPIIVSKAKDPQAFGSAVTYAKRYALQALLFMKTEDDDGNAASDRKIPAKPTDLKYHCDLHNAEMTARYSEAKKKWFTYHMVGGASADNYCFGSGTKEEQKKA